MQIALKAKKLYTCQNYILKTILTIAWYPINFCMNQKTSLMVFSWQTKGTKARKSQVLKLLLSNCFEMLNYTFMTIWGTKQITSNHCLSKNNSVCTDFLGIEQKLFCKSDVNKVFSLDREQVSCSRFFWPLCLWNSSSCPAFLWGHMNEWRMNENDTIHSVIKKNDREILSEGWAGWDCWFSESSTHVELKGP